MVDVLQTGKVLLNQSDYLIGAEQIDVSFLVSPRALFGSVGNIPGEWVCCQTVSHSSIRASVKLLNHHKAFKLGVSLESRIPKETVFVPDPLSQVALLPAVMKTWDISH